jgi:hypothetical protein
MFCNYYLNDPLFLDGSSGTGDVDMDQIVSSEVTLSSPLGAGRPDFAPILGCYAQANPSYKYSNSFSGIPPLKNLFCLYGVNRVDFLEIFGCLSSSQDCCSENGGVLLFSADKIGKIHPRYECGHLQPKNFRFHLNSTRN